MTADRRLTAAADRPGEDGFLAGAGEMGELVRSIAWETTPLELLSRWPQSLRTTMSICLNSRFPIAIYWGPEYLMLYNQSLVPMVGPIDPAFLPLIFSPFARGETARRTSAGLGLGLYVSERIIAAHDGKLSVQSAPQTGTRFEAVIPRQLPGR